MRAVARRLLVTALLAGTLALALAGPAAAARWARPFDLGHSGVRGLDEHAASIVTATDGHGDIVVAWPGVSKHGRQPVELAVRQTGGWFAYARSIDLARGTVGDPKVAINASGDAVVVFTRFAPGRRAAKVMAVPIAADGRPGAVQRVSPSGVPAELPAVAIASDGVATIVFQRDRPFSEPPVNAPSGSLGVPDVVMATSRPAGGTFAAPEAISAPAGHFGISAGAFEPAVSMSAAGEAVAAWYRNTGVVSKPEVLATGRIEAAVAPPGGAFAAPVLVAVDDKAFPGDETTLTEDAAGNTVLTWQDATDFNAAVRPAGGAFGAPVHFFTHYDNESYPAVAFSPDDTAQLVWTDCLDSCDALLSTARWTPGGALTTGPKIRPVPASSFRRSNAGPETPALVFAQARAVLTWQELGSPPDGGPGDPGTRNIGIEDAIGAAAGGGRGLAQLLSPAAHGGVYHQSQGAARGGFGGLFLATALAGGGDGPVYAVWEQADHTVQASRLLTAG